MTLLDNSNSSNEESSFSQDGLSGDPYSLNTASNTPDDMESTPQPPPELRNEQTKERYEYLRQNARKARIFYEADRTFDQEDRVTLLKAFRTQMYSQYIGSFAGLAIGISLPKFVCKAMGRPYKPSYSTLTALVTVVAGYSLAERMAYGYNINKFQGNRRYTQVFESVNGYPPVLGYSYYQETVRRPDSSFPDPSKFDWNRYPSFPLVLTSYNWYRKDIKGIHESVAPNPYRRPEATSNVPHTQYDSQSSEESTKVNPSGFDLPTDSQIHEANKAPSAWDRIREQNAGKPFEWEPQHLQHAHHSEIQTQANSNLSKNKDSNTNNDVNDPEIFSDPYTDKGDNDRFK